MTEPEHDSSEGTPSPRFIPRRVFLTDLAAAGVALVGASLMAMFSRSVIAAPKPIASSSRTPASPPPETDNIPIQGKIQAPRPVPKETDHVMPAGGIRPCPPSPVPKAPTPKKSPTPQKPPEHDHLQVPGEVAPPSPSPRKR